LAKGPKDGLNTPRVLALPRLQHAFDLLTLQVVLRATEIARNDGKLLCFGVRSEVLLFAIGHRPNDNVLLVVTEQLGRHRF